MTDKQIMAEILTWEGIAEAQLAGRFRAKCGAIESPGFARWNSYRTYLMENGWQEFKRLPDLLSSRSDN